MINKNALHLAVVILPSITAAGKVVGKSAVLNFSSEHAKHAGNLLGVSFKSRVMVPYGPDESKGDTEQDLPYSGYAFGVVSPLRDSAFHHTYVLLLILLS